VALVDTLGSLGLSPDGYIGFSFGEITCAYVDGALSAEEAILVAYYRGLSVEEAEDVEGGMAVIGLSRSKIQDYLTPDVDIACYNSEQSYTVSGPRVSINSLVLAAHADGVFASVVDANWAFHSRRMAPASQKYEKYLRQIWPTYESRLGHSKSSKWISTSWSGEIDRAAPVTSLSLPEYFQNNFSAPVQFHAALAHIPPNSIVIEISSSANLQSILRSALSPTSYQVVSLTNKKSPLSPVPFLLKAIGTLYSWGIDLNLSPLHEYPHSPLSTIPPPTAGLVLSSWVTWDHAQSWTVANFNPNLQKTLKQEDKTTKVDLTAPEFEYLTGNRISMKILFPMSQYLVFAWKAFASENENLAWNELGFIMEHVVVHEHLWVTNPYSTVFHFNTRILRGSGIFEVTEGNRLICSGKIRAASQCQLEKRFPQEGSDSTLPSQKLSKPQVYKELRIRGYSFSPEWRGILGIDKSGTSADLAWNGNWITFLESLFHVVYLQEANRGLVVGNTVEEIRLDPKRFYEGLKTVNNNDKQDKFIRITATLHGRVLETEGIRFQNVTLTGVVPERDPHGENLQLEKYVFVPYLDGNIGEEGTSYDETTALGIGIDAVLENLVQSNIKIAEIWTPGPSRSGPFLNQVFKIMRRHPLRMAKLGLVILNSSPSNEESTACNFPNIVEVTHSYIGEKFEIAKGTDLLISNISDTTVLDALTSSVQLPFILCHGPAANVVLAPALYNLIGQFRVSMTTGVFHLFKARRLELETKLEFKEIRVTNQGFEWIDELKCELKNLPREVQSYRILLSAEKPTSGILGLTTCLRQEAGGDAIRCLYNASGSPTYLSPETMARIIENDLVMNVVDQRGRLGSYRHLPYDFLGEKSSCDECSLYLDCGELGNFSSLKWTQGPPCQKSHFENEQCTVEVSYGSVCFRDTLVASGKMDIRCLPGSTKSETKPLLEYPSIFGVEYSGIIGGARRVMGMVPAGGLSTNLTPELDLLWDVPEEWSLDQAATVPDSYACAFNALVLNGQIQAGETLLIHHASGHSGMAAIAIALGSMANVLAVVGSIPSQKYLLSRFPGLGETNVYVGNDLGFEPWVSERTNGEGVDLAFAAASEEIRLATFRVMAPRGRYLEHGKSELSFTVGVPSCAILNGVSYHGSMVDQIFHTTDQTIRKQIQQLVSDGIKSGVVRPFESVIYCMGQIEEAFRYVGNGDRVERAVINMDGHARAQIPTTRRLSFSSVKSYIVVGGVGGFGLQLAYWLIEHGARNVVLVTRSASLAPYQSYFVSLLKSRAKVEICQTPDVGTMEGAQKVLRRSQKLGSIGGIFNLAMVSGVRGRMRSLSFFVNKSCSMYFRY